MSTLVVVAYPDEFQAEEVRLRLLKMQKEYLVDLEDAVIAVRKPNGKIKLLQLHNLTGAGAVSGALADVGIDDEFMKNLGKNLKPGGSMLFILFRSITMDKALQELEGTGGTIIQTSLSHEDEARLRKAMNAADGDHECDAAEETISRNSSQGSNLRCSDADKAPAPAAAPADDAECDPAEETISRNSSRTSNLHCGEEAPKEEPINECDAAEETISRNSSQNSNLHC